MKTVSKINIALELLGSMSHYVIEVSTKSGQNFVEITPMIIEQVKRSGVKNGVCFIYVPHTTAGVTLNENADTSVAKDILNTLNRLIPVDGEYKASIVGHNATLLVEEGELVLGTWQGVFLCEFDGPRRRRILVKIVGE